MIKQFVSPKHIFLISGSALGKLTDVDEYIEVGPQKDKSVEFNVESKNYLGKGARGNSVKVDILCGAVNANEVHSKQALVDFIKPKINVEVNLMYLL